MKFAAAPLPADLVRHYRQSGFTSDVTIPALMRRNKAEFGNRSAILENDTELSWAELIDAASRFGGYLHSQGIGPGDVVVWQLPNWWESLVVAYGIWAAGAISSPVVPIYREFELGNVIGAVEPRCIVTAREFHGNDHVEMMAAACAHADAEPPVRVVVRGTAPGWTTFEQAISASPHLSTDIDVDAPALVGWTSGTTSGSKGVAHSTRGFLSIPARSARLQGLNWSDRSYMPAPVAHATGLLSAIATPIFTGSSAVLRDGWKAEQAIDDIIEYRITTSSGAAVFMREIIAVLEERSLARLPLISGYPCGGSTIPVELAEACDDVGMLPSRSWGMTECPGVTGAAPRLHSREIRTASDGLLYPGCEVRLLDDHGDEVATGEAGDAWVRGPQRTLGYLDPAHTADAFDDAGWFNTGDMGALRSDGSFVMTGRKKEIINRGGEKLSAREIEDAIATHELVREVAVVAAPHDRLGEQPAAFVLAGATVDPEELANHLHGLGMAPQKVPRIWRFVDELPRTASGKVRKNQLEAMLED